MSFDKRKRQRRKKTKKQIKKDKEFFTTTPWEDQLCDQPERRCWELNVALTQSFWLFSHHWFLCPSKEEHPMAGLMCDDFKEKKEKKKEKKEEEKKKEKKKERKRKEKKRKEEKKGKGKITANRALSMYGCM